MTTAMGGGIVAAIGGTHGKRAAMRRQGDGAGQVGIAVEAVRRQWQASKALLVRGLIINPQANADAQSRVQTQQLSLCPNRRRSSWSDLVLPQSEVRQSVRMSQSS